MSIKLSIVTCTYNSEKYLGDCIAGVISQGLSPAVFEHIFVDGQSSDRTTQIIKEYQDSRPDYTIKVLSSPPKGIYNAMNIGIQNSSGQYVMFCNGDDFLTANVLSNYLSFVDNEKADVYYTSMNMVDENKKNIGCVGIATRLKKILFHLGFNVLVYHPTSLIKKSLFEELGYYEETKKIASDYGFRLACIRAGKKFVYYACTTANFRYHADSMTSNANNKSREWDENLYFRKKYLGIRGRCVQQLSLLKYRYQKNR